MGWFLTRESVKGGKKKASAKKSGRMGGSASPKWDPQRTMVGLQVIGWVALVVGLVVGWRFVERGVGDYAQREWSKQILAEDVLLKDVPGWMLADERGRLNWIGEEVCHQVAAAVCSPHEELPSPLDGARLQRSAGLVSDISWVKELKQMRRLKGGKVLVEATYREPVALVPTVNGYRAVDDEGYVLPMLLEKSQVRLYYLPVITGVQTGYAQVGERWENSSLMAGISVAEMLRYEDVSNLIDAIDVSMPDRTGRTRVKLQTASGIELVWGRSPLDDQGIEVSCDEKLMRLREVLGQGGNELAAYGVKVVEIHGAEIKTDSRISNRGGTGMHQAINRF